jgi:hypothetical protein
VAFKCLALANAASCSGAAESGHSGEFVEVGVVSHILDDDVVIGTSNGLGFVRLNVALQREWIVKSKGEGHEVGEKKED